MPKFAIFGGTFNPVHWGHLLIAEAALDQFCLDRVIWVPTVRPPHKAPPSVTFEHRLEMVSRAIADHPAFTVSAVDAQQDGISYAIATLRTLQTLNSDACWYWILGNDAFQNLPKWKDSQELVAQCIWLVAPRVLVEEGMGGWEDGGMGKRKKDANINDDEETGSVEVATASGSKRHPPLSLPLHPFTPSPHWHPLQMPSIAISSSLIRQRCRDGRSLRYLVPEAVRCYMIEQVLYQTS